MSNRKNVLLAWIPTLAWTGVIIGVTLTPQGGPDLPGLPHVDKLFHAGAFFLLGALGFMSLRRTCAWPAVRVAAATLAWTVAFGVLDEVLQRLVPGRSMDGLDALADATGSVLGIAAASRLARRR